MAFYYDEPAHTFSEYLLVPGYSSEKCIPAHIWNLQRNTCGTSLEKHLKQQLWLIF